MDILNFVAQTLLGELIVVVVGVLFANFLRSRWEEWRYGGWRVQVREGETTHVNRAISARKAKEILEEPADLAVFLKGIASPYAFLTCDLVEDGRELGLLVVDRDQRHFLIDLEKNPAKKPISDIRKRL